jgi:hypothetical protein
LRPYATAERTFAVTAGCTRVASRTLFYSEAAEADGIREWMEECTPACDGMRSAPQCESEDLGKD